MASTPFSTILRNSHNFTTATFLLSRTYCSSTTVTNQNNLFSRISPLGDPCVSIVPVLDNWLREGNDVNDQQLQRIIKILRNKKRFNHALQVSEWMSSNLIGRVRGLDNVESYFQSLSDRDKTEKLHGALLNCYVRERLVDKSLSQMQKMKDMGFVSVLSYNNIMCLYTQTQQLEKVPSVLAMMREDGVSPDIFSYSICINSYGARSDLVNMEKLLEEVERESHIDTDFITYSMVANFYIKAGMKEKALICLRKCEDKAKHNAIAYNHLISHVMMRLWKLQKANCKKQFNREYITMLGCLVKLGDLDQAEKILNEWELSGNTYDFRVPNIVLIGYSNRGLIEKAETMLRSMVEKGKTPTPNSWAIIASGYVAKKNMEKAIQCMKEAVAVKAENKRWRPKANVISSILSWATSNRDIEEVEDFVNSLKTVISMNRDMYLSLIKVCVRCGKEVDGILESMKADNVELDEEIRGNS
ncbi:Tetratricopeptide-like helical domain superfamily [Sesbania bispinosa]|nr:Tetratricopeptide-like helical domain superfamily [Sesbania bispinosa]